MPHDDDIYQERILEHSEDPFHKGNLPTATHAHEEKNPLCGDIVRVELEIDADSRIVDCWFTGDGCIISQASASMLLERIQGMTVDEVQSFGVDDMLDLFGAKLMPLRQRCCLLCWKVVQQAVHAPLKSS